jgi:hypothetical protein
VYLGPGPDDSTVEIFTQDIGQFGVLRHGPVQLRLRLHQTFLKSPDPGGGILQASTKGLDLLLQHPNLIAKRLGRVTGSHGRNSCSQGIGHQYVRGTAVTAPLDGIRGDKP